MNFDQQVVPQVAPMEDAPPLPVTAEASHNDAFADTDLPMENMNLPSEPPASNARMQFLPPSISFSITLPEVTTSHQAEFHLPTLSFNQPTGGVLPNSFNVTGFGAAPADIRRQPPLGYVHADECGAHDNKLDSANINQELASSLNAFLSLNGNHDGNVQMPNAHTSGQDIQQPQQPAFPGFGSFAQQQQPTQGIYQFSIGGDNRQTSFPDHTAEDLAPGPNGLWAPGPTESGLRANYEGYETVDDQLNASLAQPSPKPAPPEENLAKRVLAAKKKLPKRTAQPVEPPTIENILGPHIVVNNGITYGESAGDGEGNNNPWAPAAAQEQASNPQRQTDDHHGPPRNEIDDMIGNQASNNNAPIDPQILDSIGGILDSLGHSLRQKQQETTNPEPEEQISPASPTESDALSADYESEHKGEFEADDSELDEPWGAGWEEAHQESPPTDR
ncbi:MAG: hypothetical protein Q9226_003525 [Calogaya cf. arnoldii]